MSSTSYVVALLGPALASATMSMLLWLPFYIGILLLLTATLAVSALPSHMLRPPSEAITEPLLSSPLLKAQDDPPLLASLSTRFTAITSILTSRPRNLTLLLASFFLTSLASSDTRLLAQYISKRYRWTFASAGYLLSAKAVVNLVLLTAVVPRLLGRARQKSQSDDDDAFLLRCAKLCTAISVLGAASIALAATVAALVPSLLLYALGSALPVFTMSLLKSPAVSSSHVRGEEEGEETTHVLFSVVMLVKALGSLVGAPLVAGAWVRGIAVGGGGMGIPFFVSAGCYLAAWAVMSRMVVG